MREPDLQFYTNPQTQFPSARGDNNPRKPQLTGLMAKAAEVIFSISFTYLTFLHSYQYTHLNQR